MLLEGVMALHFTLPSLQCNVFHLEWSYEQMAKFYNESADDDNESADDLSVEQRIENEQKRDIRELLNFVCIGKPPL